MSFIVGLILGFALHHVFIKIKNRPVHDTETPGRVDESGQASNPPNPVRRNLDPRICMERTGPREVLVKDYIIVVLANGKRIVVPLTAGEKQDVLDYLKEEGLTFGGWVSHG